MGKSNFGRFEMIPNYDEQSKAMLMMPILPFAFVKVFLKKQNESIYHHSSTRLSDTIVRSLKIN